MRSVRWQRGTIIDDVEPTKNPTIVLTSKAEDEIAGCPPDFRVVLVTMYTNDRYKERHEAVGIRSKYNACYNVKKSREQNSRLPTGLLKNTCPMYVNNRCKKQRKAMS